MNLTINSGTWKSARTRYLIGVGGVALAVSMAFGTGTLKTDHVNRGGAVTQPRQSSQPLFGSAADAAYASLGIALGNESARTAATAPMFGTAADADFASRGTLPVSPAIQGTQRSSSEATPEMIAAWSAQELMAFGVPAQAVAPLFGTEADADFASRSLEVDAR